jgi:hypothetical protein
MLSYHCSSFRFSLVLELEGVVVPLLVLLHLRVLSMILRTGAVKGWCELCRYAESC